MNGLKNLLTSPLHRPATAEELAETVVRDSRGQPLTLYHGTGAEFDEFATPAMFSTNRDYSSQFGSRVIPANLVLKNPADLRALHISPSDPNFAEIAKRLEAEGYDGAQYRNEAYIAFRPEQIRQVEAGRATPAALAATAAAAGTGAALETQRRREAPEQNLLSWLADSAKARWERTVDDVRQTASAIADVAPDFYNGFSRLPYRVLGAPVDLADTVVRPAAAFAGADYGSPVGGSDWMIAQAQEAGLLPPSSGSTAEMAGDVLGGLIDVSPVTEAAMVSRAMRGTRASGAADNTQNQLNQLSRIYSGGKVIDEDFSSEDDVLNAFNRGELLVHARRKDGADLTYGIEPQTGDFVRSTDAYQAMLDAHGDAPELLFFSDNESPVDTWASYFARNGDPVELVFVRKGDSIQKSLGTGRVRTADGREVPYSLSPIADYENPLLAEEPSFVERGDWYTNRPQDVVAVLDYLPQSKK